jgi:integrase/recombinase XerC
MPLTVENLIPKFLEYLRFEKRYSDHTVKSYASDLGQLVIYLRAAYGEVEVKELTTPMLKSWLASLKEAGTESRSINRKISALRSSFRYFKRMSFITKDPTRVLKLMKTGKRLPSFLKEDQTGQVLEDAGEEQGWKVLTADLILGILYNTGLRVSELVTLKERHVDTHLQQLKVLGKGNKERIIPVKKELLDEIAAYRDLKRQEFEEFDAEFLLVNTRGQRLNVKYVYRQVRDRMEGLKQVSKKSPHVMRHTFATHLVNNGADLNAVKELLGHASLAATQVYTHNTIEKLKDIHKKAHPKA